MKESKPHCGTVTKYTADSAFRQHIREANFIVGVGAEPCKMPMEPEEIAQALTDYLIVPAFFTGTAADLTREYLDRIWHLDAADCALLWARYTAVAVDALGLPGLIPVPVVYSGDPGTA